MTRTAKLVYFVDVDVLWIFLCVAATYGRTVYLEETLN